MSDEKRPMEFGRMADEEMIEQEWLNEKMTRALPAPFIGIGWEDPEADAKKVAWFLKSKEAKIALVVKMTEGGGDAWSVQIEDATHEGFKDEASARLFIGQAYRGELSEDSRSKVDEESERARLIERYDAAADAYFDTKTRGFKKNQFRVVETKAMRSRIVDLERRLEVRTKRFTKAETPPAAATELDRESGLKGTVKKPLAPVECAEFTASIRKEADSFYVSVHTAEGTHPRLGKFFLSMAGPTYIFHFENKKETNGMQWVVPGEAMVQAALDSLADKLGLKEGG